MAQKALGPRGKNWGKRRARHGHTDGPEAGRVARARRARGKAGTGLSCERVQLRGEAARASGRGQGARHSEALARRVGGPPVRGGRQAQSTPAGCNLPAHRPQPAANDNRAEQPAPAARPPTARPPTRRPSSPGRSPPDRGRPGHRSAALTRPSAKAPNPGNSIPRSFEPAAPKGYSGPLPV